MNGESFQRGVVWALLVLLAGVVGVRLVELARHGWRPTAPGEARWLGWAAGNEWERAALAALPVALDPPVDDTVEVVVTAGGPIRADWLRVQAQYRWPAFRVVTATVVDAGSGALTRDGPDDQARRAVAVAPDDGSRVELRGSGRLSPGRRVVAFAAAPALALGVVVLVWWWGRSGTSADEGPPRAERGRHLAALTVLGGGLTAFLARLLAAPLWSWDHHAIWGMKARRLAALGLEGDLLAGPAFAYSAGQYPVGWPMALALAGRLTGDGLPGPTLFRLAHGVVGCGLVLLVALSVRRCGGRLAPAALVATWVAATPLLWDTETFGLADLPLATMALLAFWLLVPDLRGVGGIAPGRLALAALVLGSLPWIKQEGWVLLVSLILLVGLPSAWGGREPTDLRERLGRALVLLVPAVLLALGSRLPVSFLGGAGSGFLVGDWWGRAWERLVRPEPLLAALAGVLLHPAWLGLWGVAALVWAVILTRAVVRRRLTPAAALGLVILVQLVVYGGIYLATYLDPQAHVDSSFLRIAAALAPLAAVVVGVGLGSESASGAENPGRT